MVPTPYRQTVAVGTALATISGLLRPEVNNLPVHPLVDKFSLEVPITP